MTHLDILNEQVTAAILAMEAAARRVSRLEVEIAKLTSPSTVEGRIARRGAVRAAIASKDNPRVKELVSRYLSESGIDAQLSFELEELLSSK